MVEVKTGVFSSETGNPGEEQVSTEDWGALAVMNLRYPWHFQQGLFRRQLNTWLGQEERGGRAE